MSQPSIGKTENTGVSKTVIDVTTLVNCDISFGLIGYAAMMINLFIYGDFLFYVETTKLEIISNYLPINPSALFGLIIIIASLAWAFGRAFIFIIIFSGFQVCLFLLTYFISIPYEKEPISPLSRDSWLVSWFEHAPFLIFILLFTSTLLIAIKKNYKKADSNFPKVEGFYLPTVLPQKKDHRNWWNWRSLTFAGIGCVLFGILAFAWLAKIQGNENYKFFTNNIVSKIILGIIALCDIATLRWSKPSVEKLLKLDSRPPTLVLRSYANESSFDTSQELFTTKPKFETEIANTLSVFGPSISLANPKNPIPYVGVAIEKVGEDLWQEKFFSYLDKASLVVMMIGKTSSCIWELEQLLNRNELYRTILISPPGDNKDAKEIWDFVLDKFKNNVHFKELNTLDLGKIKLVRWSKKGDLLIFQSKKQFVESPHITALQQTIRLCEREN